MSDWFVEMQEKYDISYELVEDVYNAYVDRGVEDPRDATDLFFELYFEGVMEG